MIIRLIPPPPHPTILYGLTFPTVLYLPNFGPSPTVPASWSSQLQLITSILLEHPSNIHMLDRAVGLVARTHEVCMDVPQKAIVVKFVDGRVFNIPMNSDCVRMLLGVVLDVKDCSESESQRDSLDSRPSFGSVAGSVEDHHSSGSTSIKSPKLGKHKRQRSLLFSLISSLVPKSLSLSSSSSPPPTAPPPTPLPPLPAVSRVTSPTFASPQPNPDRLRSRARATLIDIWRRHIISAFTPQHIPPAGFAEWTLMALASKVRAEIDSINTENIRSRGFGITITTKKTGGASKHRRVQSEGRRALDFGDRNDGYESVRCRAPSSFLGMLDAEDTDQVVYPRREQTDEWGVRYIDYPRFSDEDDVFALEFTGHDDSVQREHFAVDDCWGDNQQDTFDLTRVEHHRSGVDIRSSILRNRRLCPADFGLDYSDDDDSRLGDTAFDMSSTPLVPSDVSDDGESVDSLTSLRTPEEEELPLVPPVHILHPAPKPSVSRVTSSRPRSRNASAQYSSAPSTPGQASHPPAFSIPPHDHESRDAHFDDDIYSRCEYLDRIYAALEIVRSRATSEGWRLVRATTIGAKNGWMDAETERSLEIKAKRRAWSSGIRIYAPYSSPSRSMPKVWNGSSSTFRSPMSPPGLISPSKRISRPCGPIVPTGLSLGIPMQSSPLAMYSWGVDGGQTSTPTKYGILNPTHSMETLEGKRSSRVTFADSVTKLFPVCEEDNESLTESAQVDAVGFPHAVPHAVSANNPQLVEGDNEDDPFFLSPSRPRTRTTSMYVIGPTPTPPSSPVLPMFRPSTPPTYQATVDGDMSTTTSNEEGKLDTSALLLQPLSSLSISSSPQSRPSRPPLTSNLPFVPRSRAVSLPTTRPCSTASNKTRRTSFNHKDEDCEDLSRAYASPPPDGPLVISATPAPHEQFPRYAHVHSPILASKKSFNTCISTRSGKEVVFEHAGSEFTVGIEVALGRAEEGRVVW